MKINEERGEASLGLRGCPSYGRTPTGADPVGRCTYVYNISHKAITVIRGDNTYVGRSSQTLGRSAIQFDKVDRTAWISYLALELLILSDEMW
jgi:hypothetical protein